MASTSICPKYRQALHAGEKHRGDAGVAVRGGLGILFAVVGVGLAISFQLLEVATPIRLSIICIVAFTALGLVFARGQRWALLPRLMIVLYSAPFAATLGMLLDDTHVWTNTPAPAALISNQRVSEVMFTVGLIGLTGLLTGLSMADIGARTLPRKLASRTRPTQCVQRTLDEFWFFCLLGISLFLSWLATPISSLLEGSYTSSVNRAVAFNLNGANYMAYALLIVLWIDCEWSSSLCQHSTLKRLSLAAAVTWIVVVFQYLHGSRECTGLIFALVFLYLHPLETRHSIPTLELERRRRIKRAVPIIAVVLVAFVCLGSLRTALFDPEMRKDISVSTSIRNGFDNATWTYILLTNLGSASTYVQGDHDLLLGHTYVDYFFSLPPGFLTRFLGYERRLEANNNPNWWYVGISQGGISPVCVPFRNFGSIGVFVILLLEGYFIGRIERLSIGRSILRRAMVGSFVMGAFHWFWYGDMNLVRALMAGYLVFGVHHVLTSLRSHSTITTTGDPRISLPLPTQR